MSIELNSINKIYKKGKYALKDINFKFEETGFYSLVGRSGSGKSTLLNVLTLLDYPTDGSIEIFGKKVNFNNQTETDSLRNRYFSIVYENDNLFENYSTAENLKIYCNFNDLEYDEEIIFKFFDILNLPYHLIDQKVKNLSGGEKQRICILRALLTNRKIIVLDEPTSSLDYENSFDIFNCLKKISADHLIILASHNVELCEAFSDSIIFLENGEISNIKKNGKSNDKHADIIEAINTPKKSKNVSNLYFFLKYFLNNSLFYFLFFIFCFLLNASLNLTFSNYSQLSIYSMQESINNSDSLENIQFNISSNDLNDAYIFEDANKEIIEPLESKLEMQAIFSRGFNEDVTIFDNQGNLERLLSFNELNKDEFEIIKGQKPEKYNEVLVSETFYNTFCNNEESLFNRSFNIKVCDQKNEYFDFFKTHTFSISGVFKFDSDSNIIAFNEIYFEEMINNCAKDDFSIVLYFSLKGKTLINFMNNVFKSGDEEDHLVEVNGRNIHFAFSDFVILQFALNDVSFISSNFAIYLPIVCISGVVCLCLVYSLIFKNKDNITLYRIIGLNFKKSLLLNGGGVIFSNLLSLVAAWPISLMLVEWVNSSFNGDRSVLFNIVSLTWYTPFLTIVLSSIFLLGLIFVLTKYLYKRKKNVKL